MLDIRLIRENPKQVSEALKKKGWEVDFTVLLEKDARRRELLQEVESNKAEQNKLSQSIPQVKKQGGDLEPIFARVKELKASNEAGTKELAAIEEEIEEFMDELPNIPDDDLVGGGKENNEVLQVYNELPVFDFAAKDHVELCESLDLIDYKRGAKISGAGTWIYKGLGAQLEWALLNFFIEQHL